ncbi:MAG TPA: SRPBCC domain-containing protein [Glaciihabitans sp.]|jgi:uncharacterized protein YndB with AHSA1/START domain|nr:SRPBCC domain-containing protein [Glaciihabitans sp.]
MPTPTATLVHTSSGTHLELTRAFEASAVEMWAWITDTDRTAEWFGPWKGPAHANADISVQMRFEDGSPWLDAHIEVCERPYDLAISTVDEYGSWLLELTLREHAGRTILTFTHYLVEANSIGEIGAGWEYYLDMLVAAHAGQPLPTFSDYYPALTEYFQALTPIQSGR